MFEEIKRRLENGEKVELVCIDEDGFLNHEDGMFKKENREILEGDLVARNTVEFGRVSAVGVGSIYSISKDELQYFKIKESQDEIDQLIQSRSNGTYNEIAEDASDIIHVLGDDLRFTYFFSQIANKLARIKYRYSVEDSLLDIAGYAKLELERLRNEKDQ